MDDALASWAVSLEDVLPRQVHNTSSDITAQLLTVAYVALGYDQVGDAESLCRDRAAPLSLAFFNYIHGDLLIQHFFELIRENDSVCEVSTEDVQR